MRIACLCAVTLLCCLCKINFLHRSFHDHSAHAVCQAQYGPHLPMLHVYQLKVCRHSHVFPLSPNRAASLALLLQHQSSLVFRWAYNEGQDFLADHTSSDIDFAAFHHWPDNWLDNSTSFETSWIAQHMSDASALGKPVSFLLLLQMLLYTDSHVYRCICPRPVSVVQATPL